METNHNEQTFNKICRRGGRPRLLEEERRCYKIKVGFTPRQYERLAERAEAANLAEPEFIRRLCANQAIHTIPRINADALTELSKIGTNLNQLARVANTTQNVSAISQLEALVAELKSIGKAIVNLS